MMLHAATFRHDALIIFFAAIFRRFTLRYASAADAIFAMSPPAAFRVTLILLPRHYADDAATLLLSLTRRYAMLIYFDAMLLRHMPPRRHEARRWFFPDDC